MQVKKQKIFYNIKKSSVVRFGIFKRSWALSTFTQHGLRWTREKVARHKHGANTVPGDALAISLTLSVISASICTSCKGLQGRVMEAYSEWSCPLKKFLKKQERKADHCDLERDICMEKLLFVCLYFFFFNFSSFLSWKQTSATGTTPMDLWTGGCWCCPASYWDAWGGGFSDLVSCVAGALLFHGLLFPRAGELLKSSSSSMPLAASYCVFSNLVISLSSSSPNSPPIRVGSPTTITSCEQQLTLLQGTLGERSSA